MNPGDILEDCGFDHLKGAYRENVLSGVLKELQERVRQLNPLERELVRHAAVKKLKACGIPGAKMVDAAIKVGANYIQEEGHSTESWPEEVLGSEILNQVSTWIGRYIYLREAEIWALTLWVAATWFFDRCYFAPLLILQSPTKRSGKTLLLDLFHWICRSAKLTSGSGVTSAVIFRLNHTHHPTLLIDEAEKLSGRNADREIIGLLNAGYRRGAKVQRCVERKGGGYNIEELDAFGFRALAAIGQLWDTLVDRAVVIRMTRKPRNVVRSRFDGRTVETEGKEFARKLCRFASENTEQFTEAERNAPRPDWLNDRACDNWLPLFAVASLVGDPWPERALQAARIINESSDERDLGETLIHDIYQIFKTDNFPEVIKSGELTNQLNRIESSPWGDFKRGDGISTHKLAGMLKSFGLKPKQDRDLIGSVIRGYWLEDLNSVFKQYVQLVQVVQLNNDRACSGFESDTENKSCTTSKTSETRTSTESVPLYHSQSPQEGSKGTPDHSNEEKQGEEFV